MNVNFDELRKRACFAYDSLAKKLNGAIDEYEKEYSESGKLLVNCDDIQSEMDELKRLIGSIAMCYNDDMDDVFSKIYPDDESMVDFNPDRN